MNVRVHESRHDAAHLAFKKHEMELKKEVKNDSAVILLPGSRKQSAIKYILTEVIKWQ